MVMINCRTNYEARRSTSPVHQCLELMFFDNDCLLTYCDSGSMRGVAGGANDPEAYAVLGAH